MKMLEIENAMGDIEQISLKDFIEKEINCNYYHQGEFESIKERISNTQSALTKLLICLLETGIVSLDHIKDILSINYIKIIREYDE